MITEFLTKKDFSWVDVQEPETEDFERLNTDFALPYLLVQDCLRPEHLPKYEESEEGGHFLMMRSFDYDSHQNDTSVQELTRKIALFISNNRLVTIHRVELPYLTQVAEKTKKSDYPKSLHALIHQVILAVIRTYDVPVLRLQDLYDGFEHEILAKKNEHLSTIRIYHFRRQTFILKRILKQTNDSLYRCKEFWEDHPSMLQDLRENVDQLYFQLEEVSVNFEHLFQLHVSLNDQRANDVMKILTVFSSILLPLNFIASFYGMNFDYLPGLHSQSSIIILSVLMLFITITAVWYFRRKGWFRLSRE
jgi:magnesium transporter